ncbi:hypothetical protein K5D56_19125 [Pseudomonas cichorii]|uniref:Uncharacterized protein n=1 Tax=Pseudomonas lijiangensis TaxID=2995658 RepID=A0ABX8HYG3_9PSED|nr:MULTISPECIES: hypothetical protein [Pseudomonas syringae group]MBX8491685.1 hypothetical protein [Pseudomonas cichorii]MBX8500709.1 hypothetical protein [Pseudomonas lijiangensis]MBX8504511.1 hypothetical protein [Pseudomonas lijiangensis]MBX8521813.1 hypothetical protein [Pseudomonas cichorii]MBX8551414.1 hypothetical protein [Pseudomonas cichorii]
MNKNRNWFYPAFLSGVLWVFSCHSLAQTEGAVEPSASTAAQVQEIDGEAFTVLSDRIHQIEQTLQSVTSVDRYTFTAVRGQDVLLATPGLGALNRAWKVEYQVDGGKWVLKRYSGPEAIRSLKPGARINIRVMASEGAVFDKAGYRIVFGSYPHMRYELHHEEGFLKIPYGLTKPPFLATQAFTKTLLEGTFTDSKAYPLEGGVMYFELEPHRGMKKIPKTFTSDAMGKISELFEFDRCESGNYAGNFVHKHNGRNTWSTQYLAGTYSAVNVLLESMADKPHVYDFGHICKRTLINWSRN